MTSLKYAFFDFDGTISTRDSFLLFLIFSSRKKFFYTCATHLPQILLYLSGRYPNQRLKETFLQSIFQGESIARLRELADRFCTKRIPPLIRPRFWEKLHWHRNNGHKIVVVTATPEFILAPWCRANNIELLASELEVDERGYVSGRLKGLNCMGEEKVRRILSAYPLAEESTIYAYGDSDSDLPMLELAESENRFFKPFR